MPSLRFAVIGAGMAGILSAVKLAEAGYDGVTVYEKADRPGGTWRENTYPGLACDVPSHLYSYSFALNPGWSHLFSPGPEIQSYLEDVARRYGVEEMVRYGDEVVGLTWTDGRWQLETASGHRDEVDVVIAATGVLHHPKMPVIDGLESFAGRAFHSARWDHSTELEGARVGIIGTGSTAVQITSAIVDRVGSLSLFQRTAQWIAPAENPPYPEEVRSGFRADPASLEELHRTLSSLFEGFSASVVNAESAQMATLAEACRVNLETSVVDPELRARLRPDYRAGCKRLVISPDFYRAIQHPHAELVTEAIDRIEPGGVRTADGRLHELDVLVLATGFHVDAFLRPIEVSGRDGRTLAQAWAARPEAYLALSVPDFPNLFLVNGPNGPVGNFSLIEVAELQVGYILKLAAWLAGGTGRQLSASHPALEAFEADRVAAAANTVWATGCRSWYLDDRGIPAVWPWTFTRFRQVMAEPDLDAYDRVG